MPSQVVLVTGCSSGIGLTTTTRLALDPDHRFVVIATVIALSEKSELEAAVGDALNKTVFIRKLDITEDHDITTVVDETLKTHGRIDVLLNIAGFGITDVPELVSRGQMEKIFAVNVFGAIRLTQAVLPQMKERKAGKIVSITSELGRLAAPYMEFYSATKFALEGFYEGLAVSLRSFNIRVCVIEPGGTKTGFVETVLRELRTRCEDKSIDDIDRRQLQAFMDQLPDYILTTADDVADMIITKCMDVDEPVLRHLPEHVQDVVRTAGSDLTGESGIAAREKIINA